MTVVFTIDVPKNFSEVMKFIQVTKKHLIPYVQNKKVYEITSVRPEHRQVLQSAGFTINP